MSVNLTERRPAAPPPAPVSAPPSAEGRPAARVALEAVKFALVGGSGVLVNLVAFNLLLHGTDLAAMAATVAASCLAMGTNYLGFRFFTYRDRASRTRRQIALFFVFSVLGVVMESGLFFAGYHGLGIEGSWESNAVKALSIVLASVFRFLVYRTWVFSHDARRAA
ncbi:GtrA family protein [Streptomyces tropicalis]|uniref:GtrA family protein n=1 Tax=Streptomyces tropicalis TaxID=3034234 RepID=A0ABT6ADX7_9ACTN|nr:GtrA family protein [Streptomyces tropicalis]MDF3302844.1 GtrA family protein [Streptomyces tropicalis]